MERLIGPPLATTPAGRPEPGTPRSLPDDILREASGRLAVMAGLGAALWLTGVTGYHFTLRALDEPSWNRFTTPDAVGLVSVVISLLVFWFARRAHASPQVALRVSLGYLVITCLGISLTWHWGDYFHTGPMQPMISWVGVVVLMFAAMLPHPPRTTLFTGLLAASMNPIGMLIARATGAWEFGAWHRVVLMHYPDFMLVGVAVVISDVLTRLGQKVSRARELGSYHLGELIGKGGMGAVYHATHRMLARPAAIKLMRQDAVAADPATAELAATRFCREAQAAAALQSPHTVALYDFGVTADRTLYLVMELLDGMDLEHLVREHGPLPPARTVYLLRQACESLEEAHARGLVHRDIKPANLHVGRLALAHDFVKVLDFGLVKSMSLGDDGRPATRATAENVHPGTPDFMAPEMTRGEAVDGRADIYALGCVAYYMLTGRPVFEGANVFHTIARHLNEVPEPPSRHAPYPLPAQLDAIVLACLAKDPRDRPPSTTALSQALAAVPLPPWTEADAAAWWASLGRP